MEPNDSMLVRPVDRGRLIFYGVGMGEGLSARGILTVGDVLVLVERDKYFSKVLSPVHGLGYVLTSRLEPLP